MLMLHGKGTAAPTRGVSGAAEVPRTGTTTSSSDSRRVLLARGLGTFGDGYVAILLPVHLGRLGYGPTEVGLIATATLLGSRC
jgi:hypothetical protein